QVRQFARTRSGSNNYMVCEIFLTVNVYFFSGFYFSETIDNVYFVFFHQKLDAFAHSIGNTATSINNFSEVFVKFLYGESVTGCVFQVVKYLRALQKCFGWDATPV